MKGRGEDDGAEDPAASGAQHQLRTSSGGAASPDGARQQHGGLVGRRFGQPAAWLRRCGGHASPRPWILARQACQISFLQLCACNEYLFAHRVQMPIVI